MATTSPINTEQFTAAYQQNLETLFALSQTAFAGVEKLVALNLNVAIPALARQIPCSPARYVRTPIAQAQAADHKRAAQDRVATGAARRQAEAARAGCRP
jgi:hypothetical protein